MEILDHDTIEEHSFVERYRRGTLSPAQEERFEAHFMDCARCQQELEVERSFARGIKTVAAQDAARSAVRLGLLAWLARRGVGVALAALVAVAAGLGLAHLLRQNARLETRLAELAGGAELASPLAEVPVVLLGAFRGEDGPVVVTDSGGPWSLAVDAGDDPRFESYAVTISGAAGETRFEGQGLQPNALEVIQLTFPSGFLPAGEYRLVVRGIPAGGEAVEIGSYPFRIALVLRR